MLVGIGNKNALDAFALLTLRYTLKRTKMTTQQLNKDQNIHDRCTCSWSSGLNARIPRRESLLIDAMMVLMIEDVNKDFYVNAFLIF